MTVQKVTDTFVSCATLPATHWISESACPYTDSMAVFRFWLADKIPPDYEKTALQPDEIIRAGRFRRAEDRNRFVCARHMVRTLAGRYTHQRPGDICFTVGKNQKPEIKDSDRWHINVSHAGQWVLVAIGVTSVGVDVEENNPDFAFQDVLAHSFTAVEQQYIEANDSRLLFYRSWTRKEALVKATGKGLDDDFQRVPCLDGRHLIERELIGAAGPWSVSSFRVSDGYSAAIAYGDWEGIPKFYTLDSGLFDQQES
ncbi:4'-phosphopantetheinyl transferase family protein [Spirosoma luteum]|uniref:4'-phosphopantetheinyl transferase family protein n=1 Tax=Spirosoma luteum TaxID=431553 RepID=UPI000361F2C3|nr:4'-phosphopantetheinyl transferase superfamily protein [Spirosoma luteum]